MKRFIVLVVVLFCLVALRAEGKTEAKEECKCKEGEENCPCLAQSSEGAPQVETMKKKIIINSPEEARKVIANLAANAAKNGQARIRVDQIKAAKVIQKKIETVKLKIKLVNKRIKVAPNKKAKAGLIAKKKAFKNECVRLALKLKKVKAEIKQMKKQYKTQRKAEIKKKIKALVKTKNFKAVKKIKLRLHKAKIAKVKAKLKKQRKLLIKLKIKIQTLKQKKKETEKLLEKVESGTKVACELSDKIKKIEKKIVILASKATHIKDGMKPLQGLVITLKRQTPGIKLKVSRQKTNSFCGRLETKLLTELKRAKQLKDKIAAECKTVTKKAVAVNTVKIAKLASKLKKTHSLIVRIKQALETARGPRKNELKKKLKNLKKIVKKMKISIVKTKAKVDKLNKQIAKAAGAKKIAIAVKKGILEDKIAQMRLTVTKLSQKYKIVKAKAAEKCDLQLQAHRRIAKAHMAEVKGKLSLATTETDKLKQALALVKREAKARAAAERIKIKLLTTKSAKAKAALKKQMKDLLDKANKLKSLQEAGKAEIIQIQKQFEFQAQELLKKERAVSLGIQLKLKKDLEEELQKKASLKKAMLTAHDINVRAALAAQKTKASMKISALKAGLQSAKNKAKSLAIEINLREKAATDEQKEETMKRVLLVKAQNIELLKLSKNWQEDADMDLELLLKKLRAEYNKQYAHIKKQLAELAVEQSKFATSIEISFKKEKIAKLAKLKKNYKKKIDTIVTNMEKAKKDYEAYLAAAAKAQNKKETDLNKEWAAKTSKLVSKYSKKLSSVEAAYALEVKNLVRKLKQKLLSTKTSLKLKIAAKKAALASLKAEFLAKKAKLKGDIAKETATNEGLKVSVDAAKEDAKSQDLQFKKEQKSTIEADEESLVKLKKTNAILIAQRKAKLAKLEESLLAQKSKIQKEIEEAEANEKNLAASLKTQKKRYAEMKADYAKLKIKLTTSHKAKLKIEKTITAELKSSMSAELIDCGKKLKFALAETKRINLELKAQIKMYEGYQAKAVKRRKVQALLVEAVKIEAENAKAIAFAEGKKRTTCELGTPGPELRKQCNAMDAEIALLKTKDKTLLANIQKLRKEYDSIV